MLRTGSIPTALRATLRARRIGAIAILVLLRWIGTSCIARAQSVVTLSVTRDAILAGDSTTCVMTSTRTPVADTLKVKPDDRVVVLVWEDDTRKKRVAPKAELLVMLASERAGRIAATTDSSSVAVGPAGLADRVVTLTRADATSPLCRVMPFPYVPNGAALAGKTHNDIIASGEVSKALRGAGGSTPVATGTLGFHHVSLPNGNGPRRYFPFGSERKGTPRGVQRLVSWYRLDGEDVRFLVNVASTVDSLHSSTPADFAHAILQPGAGAGGNRGVDFEYFPYFTVGDGDRQQHFGVSFRFTASDALWAPLDTSGKQLVKSQRAILTAFDVRVRGIFIERTGAVDGNSLSFGLDAGFARRSVGGDIRNDPTRATLTRALGDPGQTVFRGWVVGSSFTLRQVTAYADFFCMACKLFGQKLLVGEDPKIEQLTGLQPLIGFKFEAPVFRLP